MHTSKDGCRNWPDKQLYQADQGLRLLVMIWLPIIVIFILGVGNFALHRAVLDSKHPMLDQMPGFVRALGGRMSLVAEFLVLLVAMLLAANGWPGLMWGYLVYSALNAVAGWMILSGKA